MKVIFLGVGESCDPDYPNTSLIVHHHEGSEHHLLLECGFSVPHQYFRRHSKPEDLRAVWISHLHGDHYFGLPLLLLKLQDLKRREPLTIFGPPGLKDTIPRLMDLSYGSLWNKAGFEIILHEIEAGQTADFEGVILRTAATGHSRSCLAIRLDLSDRAFFYSGDGQPTPKTLALASGCAMLIHEAFTLGNPVEGHGSIMGSIDFARAAKAENLAILHIKADERLNNLDGIRKIIERTTDLHLFMPEPGDLFVVPPSHLIPT